MSKAYTRIDNSIIRDPSLSYKAKLVFFILKTYQDFRDPAKPVWPGVPRISEEAQLSQTLVKQGLKELQDKEYIRREHRQHNTALTFILK